MKARWIGHKLQADVTIAIDDSLLMGTANALSASIKRELFAQLSALATATIHFDKVEQEGGHGHHAPDAVLVGGKLATGLLEIVDTPAGERMRLRVSRHAEVLRARLERAGG